MAIPKSLLLVGFMVLCSCSKDKKDNLNSTDTATDYTVSGNLASTSVSGFNVFQSQQGLIRVFATKTITHVMALSADGSDEKYVGELDSNGNFSLGIDTGRPYVFVFVDSNQTGENMIVGIFKPDAAVTGLETLVPKTEEGSANLGTVSVNGTTQTATMSASFTEFLTAMGIDNTTATTIGSVDDLTLRNANPDIDGNGQIDMLENPRKDFRIDVHVRSNITCGTGCGNGTLPLDHINGSYLTSTSGYVVSPSLTSVYLVYSTNYDSNPISTWVASSGVSTSLSGGASFTVSAMTAYPSPDIDNPTSYSGGTFGNMLQWGADWTLNTSGIELVGYDKPVKVAWSFNSKTLSFPYFRSRAKSGFFTFIPDIKVNQTNNKITSIDYKWKKWTGSAWADATADEVSLIVKKDTGNIGFYIEKTSSVEKSVAISIPTDSASGTIAWNSTTVRVSSGVTSDVTTLGLIDFCSGVSSYDDKLGLRIFAHTFAPLTGGPAACY